MCATHPRDTSQALPQLPGFRILSLLGRGGMGAVYLADDLNLGRKVAIKILDGPTQGNEEAGDRFLREARALAGIDHPNVLRIHSLGEEGGVAFIVTEYVNGESVAQRIARGALPPEEALRMARQAAAGLAAAWAKGIVHRDVKPSNLLLDSAGQLKVADFGLAKPLEVDSSFNTSVGLVMGTPHYVSPEQARGDPVDLRSDIYSLGVALYEMATGQKPFRGATPVQVMAHHLHSPMPPLATTVAMVSPALERAVSMMTQKRADDRPGSYAELSELLRGDEVKTPSRRYAFAALAIAAAVVAVILLRAFGGARTGPTPIAGTEGTYNERAVDVPPKYLSGGSADSLEKYLPRDTDQEGCLGTISVVVEFVVTPGGDVTELEIKNSSVAGGALLGISSRKYSPALKGGQPVRVRLRRRYESARPFRSLPALSAQVDSIQKGEMPPERALGCINVLFAALLAHTSFNTEALRGLTSLPHSYPVDDLDLDLIGWMLAESQHPSEAMQLFEVRLARLPETAREYERIGDGLSDIGQRDTALRAYRLALSLEPTDERLRTKLDDATSNPLSGRYAGAQVFSEEDVDVRPKLGSQWASTLKMPPGETGQANFSWVVTPKGDVADLKAHRTTGLDIEQYLTTEIAKWRYEPGMEAGVPVPVRVFRRYTVQPRNPPK